MVTSCGRPLSKTSKSSFVRSVTRRLFASTTVTNDGTTRDPERNVGCSWAATAVSASAAMPAATGRRRVTECTDRAYHREMRIRFLTFWALAVCVLGLAAVAAQTPVFRGGGEAVRVFVTVTDGDGRLVTKLEQKDFEVRDEGKPQPITLFDNTPQPIRLIVMLDVSGSMEGNLPLLRNAAEQLFARLRPDDVVRVGTFGRDVDISPIFTRDVELLRMALPKMIAPDAPTPLWRALDEAIAAFGTDEAEARPVVLVLSDGKDSGIFDFSLKAQPVSQAEIIDRARNESVMIYAVGM